MSSDDNRPQTALTNPAQLQATLNVIPAYTWYAAPSGGLTFVNKRTADYLGLPKDHPLRFGIDIGAPWDAHIPLLHPDDRDETRRVWSTCLRTGGAGEVSFRVLSARGDYRWFLSRAEPLRANDGTILLWAGVNLDINDAKNAGDQLRRSEAYLAEAQKLSHTAASAYNATTILYWSEETYRLFGFAPHEGVPSREAVWQRIHPEDRNRVRGEVDDAQNGKAGSTSEFRIVLPDGTLKYVKTIRQPVFSTGGKVVEVVATQIDLTERKRAEQALRESELKLREIIETVPGFLWSTDATGEPTHINQRILDYSGLRLEDFKLGGWEKLLHPNDFAETARTFYHAIQTGTSWEAIHRLRRADGEFRWYQARGEPLRDQQGRVVQWYGLSVDIDERKRAENELRATQAQLARASQAATVAELSASIAHEINQPLAGIVASAETCRTWLSGDNPNLPRARAAIERIVRDGNAAADIIRRVRALFKQAPPALAPLSINEVIDEVRRLAQPELDRRGILIELDLTPAMPPVLADRIQIQQVLMNLIRNGAEAMDASRRNAKPLVVRSHHKDEGVVVEVCDRGHGLTDLEKIFEPFYSTKPNGLGIGLAISRSIVQAHDGTLRASNNEPEGAVFSLTLPLRSEARDDAKV